MRRTIIGAAILFAGVGGAAAAAEPLADPGVTVGPFGTYRAALRTPGVKASGLGPHVLDGPERQRRQGNDERIPVENVLRGARIFEEIVRDVAR